MPMDQAWCVPEQDGKWRVEQEGDPGGALEFGLLKHLGADLAAYQVQLGKPTTIGHG